MSTEYASKGVAGSGLGLGIAGTALGLLNNGGLFGGNAAQTYTDQLQAKVAELQAEKYANNVGIEVYKAAAERDARQNAHLEAMAREITANTYEIRTLRRIVDEITHLYVPARVITPEPMPRYNDWTAPTNTAAGNT